MATIKKTAKAAIDKPKEESAVSPTTNPLIFISHDTRDADLAEEFSKLLKSASSGALKSFRASDKIGNQGIEYGLEWYATIMDKIDEASDVVCLLTQRSVERPWILYEAGVAKGKLGKKVIGIAIGIQDSIAFTGPFAQFQNNDGTVKAITKLVHDLVCKVPNLEPDLSDIEPHVQLFHKKATEIVTKNQTPLATATPESNESVVPKLFEEIKIMFENLPNRIESRIEPDFRRRKRKYHPMMLEEIMHFGMESKDSNIAFLMMVSIYKEDFPWFYEIGLETYKSLKVAKSAAERKKLLTTFERAFEMLGHPVLREMFGKSDDMYFFMKESRGMMHEAILRLFHDVKVEL